MAVAEGAELPQQSTCTWSLSVRPDGIAHFRRLAVRAIRDWAQPADVIDTVLHAVTELLSNVHRHVGDRRCVLELTRAAGAVYVVVADRSDALPVVSEPDWSAESGRGLWMLREVAAGLGYERVAGGGKRVWAEIRPTAGP